MGKLPPRLSLADLQAGLARRRDAARYDAPPRPTTAAIRTEDEPARFDTPQRFTEPARINTISGSTIEQQLQSARAEAEEQYIEGQITQREEVLVESGGSSTETEIIGDDEGEQLNEGKPKVLVGFRRELTSEGFYQKLDPVYKTLEDEQIKKLAKLKAMKHVVIGMTSLNPGRQNIKDYRAISRLPELETQLSTREVIISEQEKNEFYRTMNTDRLNKKRAREKIETYLELSTQQEVEGTVIVHKIENEKKIKLSSVSENLVTTNREAALSTVSGTTATRTPVAPIQSSAQRSDRSQSKANPGSGGGSSYR